MADKLVYHDRRTGEGREMEFATTSLSIGKSPDNDLVLNGQSISRRHCRIEKHGRQILIRDLGSRNGTFVNGQRLAADQPVAYAPGQVLQIGDFTMKIGGSSSKQSTRKPAGDVKQPRAQNTNKTPPAAAAPHFQSQTVPITPVELKRTLHARLLERMDLKHTDMSDSSNDELRMRTEQVCAAIVQEMAGELPAWLTQAALVKEVVDEAVGLGLLEELLAEEGVDEVMVCNWDKIYVERKGKLELTPKQFTDNQQVIQIIRRILAPLGRRIDETSPLADGRLTDGSRVNAIIPPLALSGPTLTIRKFATTPFTVQDLINFGSWTQRMADFLELAVRHRANILISGGTGSGKTTLLNLTSNFIPEDQRIVTIEDAAELQLQQNHVVRLESRPANIEGRNAVPIRDLVKNSLRMRPDRIVVGECRGGEALDMLQAMNTGHDGSLTTLHANNPRDAIARLETLVLMSGMELPSRAIREQIASAIDFIVQVSRLPDGSRRVTHISAVLGMEADIITLMHIYEYERKGFDADGKVEGEFKATGQVPDFVQTLKKRGIPVDMTLFETSNG